MKINNITVDGEKKEISLKLNKSFYPNDNIIKTAKKFSDMCWINFDDSPRDYLILTFKPKIDNLELGTLAYEFFNHLLASIQEEIGEF